MTSSDSFSISADAIDITLAGELLHVRDEDVQGVSCGTRVPSSYAEGDWTLRTVVIEVKEDSGTLRNLCVQRSSLDHELQKYVQRVAEFACRNTLSELATKETVQRNGFMINDQGIVLSAGGETLCCGLFDLSAFEFVGERMLLWTDGIEPAATILGDDSNSQTLKLLLPQLIRQPPSEADQHLIGVLPCHVGDATCIQSSHRPQSIGVNDRYKYVLLFMAVVCGSIAAMVVHGLVNPVPINWTFVVPVLVPVWLILGGLAYRTFPRTTTELAMFRGGIVISQGEENYEFAWSEIEYMRLNQQKFLDSRQQSLYRLYATVSIRFQQSSPLGEKIDLTWPLEHSAQTCTEFMKDKCNANLPSVPLTHPSLDNVMGTLMHFV